jgi:hypothetical protein
METEVDVMKEVLVETESEKETIEARNKDLMSQLDLLVEDQVKKCLPCLIFVFMSSCFMLLSLFLNIIYLQHQRHLRFKFYKSCIEIKLRIIVLLV